jgi:hypothetical protein
MSIKTHVYTTTFLNSLLQSGFKSFSLTDMDGNRLVTLNNTKVLPKDKIKEIDNRLKISPEGVYKLNAQFDFSRNTKPEIYYLTKGKVDTSFLNENHEEQKPAIVKKNISEKTETNVLSLDSALTRIEELSQLRAENEVLKQRVKDLEIECEQLNAELEEQPETLSEDKGNSFTNWLQTITPVLSPLADEYFKLQNRKLQLDEFREQKTFYQQQQPKRKQTVVKQQETSVYPDITNPEQVNGYFDELEKLNEKQFNEVCDFIKTDYPELYLLIEQEFYSPEENENEN